MTLQAVIFDLDGVITDTAEFHYRAWKQLADEEGLPFDRAINERLRGVSRRESLRIILDGRSLPEPRLQELMERKNNAYVAMLDQVTPDDLLPGVARLLDELDAAAIPYAVASASRNAPNVVRRLDLADRLSMLAPGGSVRRPKPAPDLFRLAAAQLGVLPSRCLVVEDACAGIEAALAAGMAALALGPAERFEPLLGLETRRVARRDSLAQVSVADLRAMMVEDEQWIVLQRAFDPQQQHHLETVFTLGNGRFASRGSFEEGYPGDEATTFLHGVFDDAPIVFTALANMPNWLDLAIQVDGESFRLDRGRVLHFRRRLDLGQAILQREVRWQAPGGAVIDLTFERFISYSRPALAALRVLATAVDRACQVQIAAGLDGHVANEDLLHWRILDQGQAGEGEVWLRARTRHSGEEAGVAAAVAHSSGQPAVALDCPGQPRLRVARDLQPGQSLQLDKLVSYATSRDGAPGDEVVPQALAALGDQTYDRLRFEQLQAWQTLWAASDVQISGDPEAQLATRFNLFQLLVAAPQADERVSIGAKTLSGYGYAGHVFWDTEIFVLPFFTYTQPALARNMLLYRYHTLPGARRKAAANGFEGAQYAWESASTGDEVTPTWLPDFRDRTRLVRVWTGDIQLHISADIPYAIMEYWRVTGDDAFMRDYGAEIILDTARFWGSRAEPEDVDGRRRYSIRDVIGPDEYHDHVDNNAYTNYIVRWHLQTARQVYSWLQEKHPRRAEDLAARLDLTATRLAHWQDVAGNVVFPYDPESGIIEQFEGFFERRPLPPDLFASATQSLQVILGIEGASESQVLKQPDVLMLLALFPDEFDRRTWQANWETYTPMTDHRYGSSLGPAMQALAACEMGLLEEAYRYFMLAAQADLRDPRGNAGDGIHAASAGGVWQAAVRGFAGLRLAGDELTVRPRLPAHWQALCFSVTFRGAQRLVRIRRAQGETYDVKVS